MQLISILGMFIQFPPNAQLALRRRVKGILFRPKTEWPKIAAEQTGVGSLYRNYVVYLAAVPAVSTLIGSLAFGYDTSGVIFRPSLLGAVWTAILQYAAQLVGVYLLALIIATFAPRFGGVSDIVGAFKLATFSATASWLAGIFTIVPALSFLTVLGLYSIYLLYVGTPVLTRVAAENAFSFTAAVVGLTIILVVTTELIFAAIIPSPGPQPGPDAKPEAQQVSHSALSSRWPCPDTEVARLRSCP